MTAGFIAAPTIVPLKAFFSGGSKNHVDTTTRIELSSGTAGVVIYYTVNGKRPAPYDRPRPIHTLEYHTPFTLAAGKVTIKAMAVSCDGLRESSVVTKTFLVEEVGGGEEDEVEEEEGGELSLMPSPQRPSSSPVPPPLSLSAQLRQRISLEKAPPTPLPSSPLPPATISSTTSSPEKSTTAIISQRAASAPTSARAHSSTSSASVSATSRHIPSSFLPPSPTPLRCSYCEMPYSERSGHLYCSQCGTSLPSLPQRHCQPPAQMSVCSGCGARVQSDVQHCPVCDSTAVIKPRTPGTIQGQASTPLSEDGIMCSECGTRNVSHHTTCVTCDASLHPSPPPSPSSHSLHQPTPSLTTAPVVMTPITGQSYAMCGRCGRVNVSDARFCDWCGSKAGGSPVAVVCGECNTAVDWLARHCTHCGAIIRAPPRSGVEMNSTMKIPAGLTLGDCKGWIPVVDIQEEKPVLINRSSQTDRFYPSAKTLSKRQEAVERQVSIQAAARDRVRKLNSFSPGKGLWRVQVDHVCAHLKAHSLSSHTFQNAIGSPMMGKLLHSGVVNGENAVDIKLQFSLKEKSSEYLNRS